MEWSDVPLGALWSILAMFSRDSEATIFFKGNQDKGGAKAAHSSLL